MLDEGNFTRTLALVTRCWTFEGTFGRRCHEGRRNLMMVYVGWLCI